MDQISVGEDLFAALVAVCLVVVFSIALTHAYHTYAERRSAYEGLDLTLDITQYLKNNVLAKHENLVQPGLVSSTPPAELDGYLELLGSQGIEVHLEVKTLDGQLVWEKGAAPNSLSQYFSPPCSVSLPVAICRSVSSRALGELSVQVWR